MQIQRARASTTLNTLETTRDVNNLVSKYKIKKDVEIVDIDAKYTGEWVEDKREGQGLISWPDGSQFLGIKLPFLIA